MATIKIGVDRDMLEIGDIVKVHDKEYVAIGYDKVRIQNYLTKLQYGYRLYCSPDLSFDANEILMLDKMFNSSEKELQEKLVLTSMLFIQYPFLPNPLYRYGSIEYMHYQKTNKKININLMTLYMQTLSDTNISDLKRELFISGFEQLQQKLIFDIKYAQAEIKNICDKVDSTREDMYKCKEKQVMDLCMTKMEPEYAKVCYKTELYHKNGVWYLGYLMSSDKFSSFSHGKNIFSVLAARADNDLYIDFTGKENLYLYNR